MRTDDTGGNAATHDWALLCTAVAALTALLSWSDLFGRADQALYAWLAPAAATDPAARLPALFAHVVLTALALLAYLFLPARRALFATLAFAAAAMLASIFLIRAGYRLTPLAILPGLALAYPLWRWRRLAAAMRYFDEEFTRLEREPHLLPEVQERKGKRIVPPDPLERRVGELRIAVRRLRDLRQFVSDSIASLPDATLVATTEGNVLLANQPARDYFASIGLAQVEDALVPYLFAKMTPAQDGTGAPFSWWNILDPDHADVMRRGIEVRDPQERDLLIKSAPSYDAQQRLAGWIIAITDISTVRAAERSRDETLHFISHDMRAPQASILALLELQQEAATALPQAEFIARIEKASRITLGLADNFVQLARAESQDYRFEQLDFKDILQDACDEMWVLAKNKNIRIVAQNGNDEYPVCADRGLLTRVLTNLLSNAIKYSPKSTTITCSLKFEQYLAGRTVLCTIADQGYGIARADQPRLFQRFQRFKAGDQVRNDGVGLGMVFVKAVLDRHHGQISFTSIPNEGTTFYIRLPAEAV